MVFRSWMVVLAFGGTVARAQDANNAAEGTQRAGLPEPERPAMALASRLAPQTPAEPLSLKGSSRDGGADAGSLAAEGTSDKLADCPVFEGVLKGRILAVRTYPPPAKSRKNPRENPPYVGAAIRCGNRYVLEVMSKSKEPWVIKQATLVGPNGEVLQVQRLGFEKGRDWDVNGILADAPPEVGVTSLKLNLTGADGRVAQIDVRDLP